MTYALQLETSLPHPGRRFEPRQERELHAHALEAAEGLPGASRGLTVLNEFAGPFGIPDFTAFVGDLSSVRARQSTGVPFVRNEVDAGILSATNSTRGRSVEWIARSLGWPAASVVRRIGGLVRTGALVDLGGRSFVRNASLAPSGRLYAIETKVDDWSAALRQVRAYRIWADAYVLVMGPLSPRVIERLVPEVQADRGGLVLDGAWVLRPRLGYVASHRRVQAAEYFAAATPGI